MELINVKPTNDGKRTLVTMSVLPADAERLLKAFAEGQLEALGVTKLYVDSPTAAETPTKLWTKAEQDRSTTASDTPSIKRP
jgi:hypothetical protein